MTHYSLILISAVSPQGTNAHVVLETAGAAFNASLFAGRPCVWRRHAFWYAPAPHALQQGGVRVMPGVVRGPTIKDALTFSS
jgi:hypothetical protein